MRLLTVLSMLFAMAATGCSTRNRTDHIPAVTNFNLQRYMGTWYEIARYPHSFESGLSHVSATYRLLPNNKVQVLNQGISAGGIEHIMEGVAVTAAPSGSGNLKVSFFRPFYSAYRIIYLSPDYDLAIVTSSTKDYLWLLSRTRQISKEQKEFLLKKITDYGFSTQKLVFVDQTLSR